MSPLEAREELGSFLRGFRENYFSRTGQNSKHELSRRRLAGRAKTSEEVIINLEHGVVNPERSIFERVITALELSEADSITAYSLLNLFSRPIVPRRKKRGRFDNHHKAMARRLSHRR